MIQGQTTTALLQVGSTLAVDATAGVAQVIPLAHPIGSGDPGAPVTVQATTQTFGPYTDLKPFKIACLSGTVLTRQNDPIIGATNQYQRPYMKTVMSGDFSGVTVPAGSVLKLEAGGGVGFVLERNAFNPVVYVGNEINIGPFEKTRYFIVRVTLGFIKFITEWFSGVTPTPTPAPTNAINSFRGANTRASAGGVNTGALLNEPMIATTSTYTQTSGTVGHWNLPTNGTHPTPTTAGQTAALNGGPYNFDYTISDGTRTVSDKLTITAVSSWTVPAELTTGRIGTKLAADPIAPTKFYTVSQQTEIDAIKAAATTANGGAVIFLARGMARFAPFFNAWTAPPGWIIVTDEDINRRSPISGILANNGTLDRIGVVGTYCNRRTDLDGGTFAMAAYRLRGSGRTILCDIAYDQESTDPTTSVDLADVRDKTQWHYMSTRLARRFGTIQWGGGELLGGELYFTAMYNNGLITSGTSVGGEIKKLVVAGSGMRYEQFQGWHPDGIQFGDTATMTGQLTIRELHIYANPYDSMQGIFAGMAPQGGIVVDRAFIMTRAQWAIKLDNIGGVASIKNLTVVPEPDATAKTPTDYPGSMPSVSLGSSGSATGSVTDSFIAGNLTVQPGMTQARNTVLTSGNRNIDLSAYFAAPLTTRLSDNLSAQELEAIIRVAYAPTTALRNPDGTYQGAFMPDGSNNVGLTV